MKYTTLSNTGLIVSKLCLGTMTFGGSGKVWETVGALEQYEADELVHKAIDSGVNFFDTANVYGQGDSESILGRALENKRKDVVVATKVQNRVGDGVNEVGLSRSHILNEVEKSLKRLKTDYIDLYQIHGPDPLVSEEDVLNTLNDLVRSGKVRYIGCSNLAAWQIMKFQGIASRNGLEPFKSAQAYVSLADRGVEREIVPAIKDLNIALLAWSPLAGGYLSGKYHGSSKDAPRARRDNFQFPPIDGQRCDGVVDVLKELARERNRAPAALALAWVVDNPYVTSTIIGATNPAQLESNLGSVDIQLTDAEREKLNEVSALSKDYPQWIADLPFSRMP